MFAGLLRSVLYMPASNARAIDKARVLPCDAVIIDLEDAVAPDAKAVARSLAIAAISEGGFGTRRVVLRVNGLDTAWGEDDLAACRDADVAAVLIPKVSAVQDLQRYRTALGNDTPIWGMVETCSAVLSIGPIAAAAADAGLTALVAGTNDLAKEMKCTIDASRTALLPALTAIVIAARAHGLVAIDGVFNALDDDEGLRTECAQGRMLGFDGKTLIHPKQIALTNVGFQPSDEEICEAREIIAAFENPVNAGKGAISVGGRMVELLHLERARELCQMAD